MFGIDAIYSRQVCFPPFCPWRTLPPSPCSFIPQVSRLQSRTVHSMYNLHVKYCSNHEIESDTLKFRTEWIIINGSYINSIRWYCCRFTLYAICNRFPFVVPLVTLLAPMMMGRDCRRHLPWEPAVSSRVTTNFCWCLREGMVWVPTQTKSGELEVRLRALTGLAKQEAFVFTLQSLIHKHNFIPKC
jgi:hypothetical protein